ncbi:hypothetical protein [Aurantiacibacter luteus]|uniref:hypothetical protein n=1 Tax=Aurantiacibacter luteus TaxID=1581420 RepID=UPI000A488B84|nr:hypothetical protein [Aurantiacibacter luteus]
MQKPIDRRGARDTAYAVRHTVKLIRTSQEYASLSTPLQSFLDAQLDGPARIDGTTPSSALPARLVSTQVLQAVAQLHFNDLLGRNREPFLGTFSFLNGETGIGDCLRNVQTTFSRVEAALEHFGLEGVLIPDIDILLPAPSEQPIVAFHLHGILTGTEGRKVRLRRTAERIEKQIGWDSRLPDAIRLRGKLPGDLRLHAENIATYAGKFVAAPKVPYEKGGNVCWRRDRGSNSAFLAIGALCAWSQIPLLRMVKPIGTFGKSFQSSWLRKMRVARRVGQEVPEYAPNDEFCNWNEILCRFRQSS